MDAAGGQTMERDGFQQAERVGRRLGQWLGGPPGLALHVGLFLLGATFLTLVNLLRSPQDLWFWRPLAWWGGLLLLHAAVTVGGVVRRVEADAPAPQPVRPVRPVREARGEPRLKPALQTVVARTATTAAALVAGGVAVVERSVAGRGRGDRRSDTAASVEFASMPPGWSVDDDAAFASWARSTDTWRSVPAEEPASGGRANGRHTPSDPPRRAPADADLRLGMEETNRRPLREKDGTDAAHRTPSATGRFQPNGGTETYPEPAFPASPRSPISTNGNGHGSGDWTLPAAVEALWSRNPAPDAATRSPDAARGSPELWASPSATAIDRDLASPGDNPGQERGAARSGIAAGRDVVLDGSVPVDPKDPAWTRLEAAAAAWLARRDAQPTPTPLPTPPAPTGTEDASSTSG